MLITQKALQGDGHNILTFFKGDEKGNQSLILPKVNYGPGNVAKFVTVSSSYQIELEGKTLSSVSSSAPRIEL